MPRETWTTQQRIEADIAEREAELREAEATAEAAITAVHLDGLLHRLEREGMVKHIGRAEWRVVREDVEAP